MSTVLITGATGLLGSTLIPGLLRKGFKVITHSQHSAADFQADLANQQATSELLDQVKPDTLINLVGLTNVDLCETQPNAAYIANTKIVENITDWIKKTKTACHLVQISTDQVYDGEGPHYEDLVKLTNYYAFSKYAGELLASRVSSTILRTNFFGYSHCEKRQSLTDWLFLSLSDDIDIQVFDDVMFSPLSMTTIAEIIQHVIKKKPNGVFNLGSRNGMSKADFAFAFAGELNLNTNRLQRTTTKQVTSLKTYRPKDMRMDCTKLEETFKFKLPLLIDEIKLSAKEYNEQTRCLFRN